MNAFSLYQIFNLVVARVMIMKVAMVIIESSDGDYYESIDDDVS